MQSMNDFYIGNKPEQSICAALLLESFSNLSENKYEYWYHDDLFDGKIAKDSKLGLEISRFIKANFHLDKINKLIRYEVIKIISPKDIFILISNCENAAYEKGKEDKQKEIQKVLGLRK